MILFNGQGVDGTGDTVYLRGANAWAVHVSGTFGSGTFKLEIIDKFGTAIDVPNSSVSAESVYKIEVPSGTKIRGVLSGSTNPDLNAYVEKLN